MRGSFSIKLSLIVLFSLIAAGCGSGQKEVKLLYKFNPDNIYSYDYNGVIEYSAYEAGNLVARSDSVLNISYRQRTVEMIDTGKAKIAFEYTLKNPTGEQLQTWSSEFIMNTNGQISYGEDTASSAAPQLSENYSRQMLEQAAPMFPAEKITRGFVWSHTVKVLQENGMTDATTNYKVTGFANENGYECAVINYSGTMIIPLEGQCLTGDILISQGTDQIKLSGTMHFAYEEGIMLKENGTSHLVRRGTVRENGKETDFRIEENRDFTIKLRKL